MQIEPLGNRLTLRTPKAPDKIGNIWLPEQAKESYTVCQAEIVARGPEVSDLRLQPGLTVVTKRFGGFAHDGEREVFTVYESHILAIVGEL